MIGQFPNITAQTEQDKRFFIIPAGQKESNVVDLRNASLNAFFLPGSLAVAKFDILGAVEKEDPLFPVFSLEKSINIHNRFNWDIQRLLFPGNLDVSAHESDPTGVFFRPDGTRMFVIGSNTDSVHTYVLSTPWDITTASFVNSFDFSNQESSPTGVAFSTNGIRMFVIGFDTDSVHAYRLSIPWDITTASPVGIFDVTTQEALPQAVAFHPDGVRMFVTGFNTSTVYAYELSTPWDITTASFANSFDISSIVSDPRGMAFHPSGSQMLVLDGNKASVVSYIFRATSFLSLSVYDFIAYRYLKIRMDSVSTEERIITAIIRHIN